MMASRDYQSFISIASEANIKRAPKPFSFDADLVGKEGLEPSRLAARDPKSRLSANSSTSPIVKKIISEEFLIVNECIIILRIMATLRRTR
jgi:hypothetical protein